MKKSFVVDAGDTRLDLFLGQMLELSRAKARALLDDGKVRVDGRRAPKGLMLTAGQTVEVDIVETSLALVPEAEVALSVLWEDSSLIAVDKRSGMPSHPLRPGETGTVANALVARYPECETASEDAREAGLVHRLDTDTSGVMVAARTAEVWRALRTAFTQRHIDKTYWALTCGPIADEGDIDLPLLQAGGRVRPDNAGREALSSFRVLRRVGPYCLVEVKILTGVMHQVRAHLAAVGAPLLGDTLYGGPEDPVLRRFFLHARALGFTHPTTGVPWRVEAPLPTELSLAQARYLEPSAPLE